MQITQSRRDFLACASLAAAAGALGGRGSLADEGAPEIERFASRKALASAVGPRTSPTICCVRKGSPTSATFQPQEASTSRKWPDAVRSTLASALRHQSSSASMLACRLRHSRVLRVL